jgi:phosphoenolpyruvate synthase/pyruvate phosphate dikinase
MPPAIRRIETLVPKRAADYGGKACHLAKLARAGFPVPAAIAIPAAVAEALFAERLGVEDRPAALLAREVVPEARLASIRARVRSIDLGAALERELREALEALRREGNVSFAVRSSSTREDGADASAAGLHQTHLHRQTDAEVFAAVRDCWASLFTERALTYLRRHGAAEAGMGVVVASDGERRRGGRGLHRQPAHGRRRRDRDHRGLRARHLRGGRARVARHHPHRQGHAWAARPRHRRQAHAGGAAARHGRRAHGAGGAGRRG